MTNADRIRDMDDEELAAFLDNLTTNCVGGRCDGCPIRDEYRNCDFWKWIGQEADNET